MRFAFALLTLAAALCLPAFAGVGDVQLSVKGSTGALVPVTITKTNSRALGWDSSGTLGPISISGGSGSSAWEDITDTPTTLSGYGITDAQPLNDKLTTLATGFGGLYVTPGLVRWTGTTYELLNSAVQADSGGTGFSYYDTAGVMLYSNSPTSLAKLAANTTTTKKYLTQTGTGSDGAAPVWSTIQAADVPTLNQSTTGTASGLSTTLAITSGGTGGITASEARANLGLGSLATQSGTFSGTSSGTNTGDQTITLTGDVTGSGSGSFAATLANTSVVAGTYGTATSGVAVTVDAKGRLTTVTTNTITPAIGSITGFGTGIATALAINTGSAGAPVLYNGALGAPSSGVLTNCTVKDFYPAALSNESDALTTGLKLTFRIPYACTLSAVRIDVSTAPTGSVIIVDVKESGTTIFSTKPQIAVGDKTSVGGAVPGVISDTALAENAEITVFVDQIGSTIAGAGLKIVFILTR